SKVDMASVTSWGVALSAQTETGRPLRSATAMIFVPLPRSFFRPCSPLFCGCEARVDECFTNIDCASLTEFARRGSHDPRHPAGANPLLKSAMAGLERGVSVGEIRPGCTSP